MKDLKTELLNRISDEISPEAAGLWLDGCSFVGLRDGQLEIEFPSEFKRKMVERRFGVVVSSALNEILGSDYPVRFTLEAQSGSETGENEAAPGFESFVKGKNNELALACVLSATDRPSERLLHPVYIYGATGLGKTHLLKAAEKRINRLSPEMKTLYVTVEEFLELFGAPAVDCLLLDDYFPDEKGRIEAYLKSALENGVNVIAAGTLQPEESVQNGEFCLPGTDIVCTPADIQPPDSETLQVINCEKALRKGRLPDNP